MFQDRKDAGRQLAARMQSFKDKPEVLVLGLPRGGVVVSFEIAAALHLQMDVLIVRKLGFPGQPELAIGAVSETGTVALNRDIIAGYNVSSRYVDAEVERQKEEISRRVDRYRGGKMIAGMENKIIVLVDDGVATGATMKAAALAIKRENVAKLVISLPVAPPETASELRKLADEFICLETPSFFMAVGAYYMNFPQTTDEEVIELLHQAAEKAA